MDNLSIKKEFSKIIEEAIRIAYPNVKIKKGEVLDTIVAPKNEHGDISSSISFALARTAKTAPAKISDWLARVIKEHKLIEQKGMIRTVESENGYLNGWYNEQEYAKAVLSTIIKEREKYGASKIGKKSKVIVESPAVNPTKPWHVGHLRNALLGDSISNIYSFCSFNVEREDYIDDLGFQSAETLWGYMNLGSKANNKKFDQFLGEEYVKVNQVMKKREISKEINELLKKMEEGKTKEARLNREIAERCVMAQYETAARYGISKNVLVWESNIVEQRFLEKALKIAKEKGAIETHTEGKYANCSVMDLRRVKELAKEFENPEEHYKVLVRSNGVATYAAKDFAFHLWKFGLIESDFKFRRFIEKQPNGEPLYTTSEHGEKAGFGSADYTINIIDMSQSHEQSTVRALFKLTGYDEMVKKIIHLAYGKVSIKGGTLSGREGGWLGEERNYTADDLLREMEEKTLEIVRNSEKIEDKSNEKEIAKKVALSAIKFEFLRTDPEKAIVFQWEKALDLNSNSGPYCMYMYARASRILEKAEMETRKMKVSDEDYKRVERSYDFELVKLIGKAQEIVEKAARENRPNVISDYLMELSLLFGKFYEHMPVLKGEESRQIRIAIVWATRQVIYNMLGLFGIETVESM